MLPALPAAVRRTLLGALYAGLGLFAAAGGAVRAQSAEDCLNCHSDDSLTATRHGKEVSAFVDGAKFEASIHGQAGLACVDCHAAAKGQGDGHDDDLAAGRLRELPPGRGEGPRRRRARREGRPGAGRRLPGLPPAARSEARRRGAQRLRPLPRDRGDPAARQPARPRRGARRQAGADLRDLPRHPPHHSAHRPQIAGGGDERPAALRLAATSRAPRSRSSATSRSRTSSSTTSTRSTARGSTRRA